MIRCPRKKDFYSLPFIRRINCNWYSQWIVRIWINTLSYRTRTRTLNVMTPGLRRVAICEIVSNCLNRPFNKEWIAISCYRGCSCSIDKLLLTISHFSMVLGPIIVSSISPVTLSVGLQRTAQASLTPGFCFCLFCLALGLFVFSRGFAE